MNQPWPNGSEKWPTTEILWRRDCDFCLIHKWDCPAFWCESGSVIPPPLSYSFSCRSSSSLSEASSWTSVKYKHWASHSVGKCPSTDLSQHSTFLQQARMEHWQPSSGLQPSVCQLHHLLFEASKLPFRQEILQSVWSFPSSFTRLSALSPTDWYVYLNVLILSAARTLFPNTSWKMQHCFQHLSLKPHIPQIIYAKCLTHSINILG